MFLFNNGIIATPAANPLWDSLYAAYKAESNADDSLGVYNGTAQGGLTYGTGVSGSDFVFNGTNAYVSLANNSLNFTTDFSVSAWINLANITGTKVIIGNLLQTPITRGWRFEVSADTLGLYIFDASSNTFLQAGGSPLSASTWYHVVFTRLGSTRTRIYVNGSSSISNSDTRNPVNDTTMYTTIGVNQFGSSNFSGYFNGSIDEVYVWNREITADEVTELYNSGSGTFY